jgi:hypothetical protein
MNILKRLLRARPKAEAQGEPLTSAQRDRRSLELAKRLIKAYRTSLAVAVTPPDELAAAKEQLANAGKEGIEAIVHLLTDPQDTSRAERLNRSDLVCTLAAIGDESALTPLMREFGTTNLTPGGTEKEIAAFIARIGAKTAAPDLIRHLDDDETQKYGCFTSHAAAYALGRLCIEETRGPLRRALHRYGYWIKKGLTEAGTEFSATLISEWDAERKRCGPDVRSMDDTQMINILTALCAAYAADNRPEMWRLEPLATDIGEELNRRGGGDEMERVYLLVPRRSALERVWRGIGPWS